jgi:hypothetical protein
VSAVDWLALAFVAFTALLGLKKGLIASALSLAGILVGAIVGARLAPHLLADGSASPYTPLAGLAGAAFGAVILEGDRHARRQHAPASSAPLRRARTGGRSRRGREAARAARTTCPERGRGRLHGPRRVRKLRRPRTRG